jgi:hypothetical protein
MRFLILAMTALALTGCVTHQQRQQAAADGLRRRKPRSTLFAKPQPRKIPPIQTPIRAAA